MFSLPFFTFEKKRQEPSGPFWQWEASHSADPLRCQLWIGVGHQNVSVDGGPWPLDTKRMTVAGYTNCPDPLAVICSMTSFPGHEGDRPYLRRSSANEDVRYNRMSESGS
jgi:hypothetical protein